MQWLYILPSLLDKRSLDIVRAELEADMILTSRTEWKIDDIMELLKIAMETCFKTRDGKIYFQTDGTPIGKSISEPLAGIYMNWFEKTYVFNDGNHFKPVMWKRMRDDILSSGIKVKKNLTV